MAESETGRPLKTLDTALELLDTVQENEGLTLREIAEELDLARSTVHGYVKTLERSDYLVQEGNTFYLGMTFLEKGGHVRFRKPAYKTVIPMVDTLAEQTDERVQFVVEENGRGTYIHTATGNNAVQVDARIGKRINLHASSSGKAILAQLPSDYVDEIISLRGLPRLTDNTITDRSRLESELEEIRERGYAVSDQESIPGLRAVGAAVVANGEVIGGISVSAPAHRIKDERLHNKIPDLLLGVTNELQLRLEYE